LYNYIGDYKTCEKLYFSIAIIV